MAVVEPASTASAVSVDLAASEIWAISSVISLVAVVAAEVMPILHPAGVKM